MNDDLLSQSIGDYSKEDQDKVLGLIEEERAKTKAMLAPSAEAGAILIGSVGAPDGTFTALGG